MKIIELRNISKTYDPKTVPVQALRGVSLDFSEGEFTAIVGPSGSGKTTLMNMIGGLDDPDSGEVIIGDTVLGSLSAGKKTRFRRDHIGFVFQSYNLIPVLSARENIEFIMHLQGRSPKERKERTDQLLMSIGLSDRGKSRPAKLSGGQQQRIAIARALAAKPRFLLADEPTANLDSEATENLLSIMEQLNREEHMTFIFSTHDARVVKRAKRIITLEDGKVASDINKAVSS
jgi:putative ABC transport system ATP-binding protein